MMTGKQRKLKGRIEMIYHLQEILMVMVRSSKGTYTKKIFLVLALQPLRQR